MRIVLEVCDSTVTLASNEDHLVLLVELKEGHTSVLIEPSPYKRGAELSYILNGVLSLGELRETTSQDQIRVAKEGKLLLFGTVVRGGRGDGGALPRIKKAYILVFGGGCKQ